MTVRISQTKSFLFYIFEPKSIILGFTLFHFLSMLIFVGRELQTEAGRTADVYIYLSEPILLLIAALGLWRSKLWSYIVAIFLSGLLIYTFGYRWLEWAASEINAPIMSIRTLSEWMRIAFSEWQDYPDRPRILLQIALAALIGPYSVISAASLLFQRVRKSPTESNKSLERTRM